jgi:hypothetical protein
MFDHSSFREVAMNMENVGKWCAVAAVLVLIIGLFVVPKNEDDRRAFMNECQMDNLKHYQCVSLWNGGGIPIFRSRDITPIN